jgi:hypothetical protein
MSWLEAKSQNFFATAPVVGAVMLCWSAEAASKNLGHNQIAINASSDVATQIAISDPGTVTCRAYNKSDESICVVYDVYPVWYFSQSARGTVSHFIAGKTARDIAWAFPAQRASMKCKLVSATYVSRYALCQ